MVRIRHGGPWKLKTVLRLSWLSFSEMAAEATDWSSVAPEAAAGSAGNVWEACACVRDRPLAAAHLSLADDCTVFVRNLGFKVTDDQLEKVPYRSSEPRDLTRSLPFSLL